MLHLCINVSEYYIRAGPETRAGGDRYFQDKHCFLLLNSEIKISTHLNKERSRYSTYALHGSPVRKMYSFAL